MCAVGTSSTIEITRLVVAVSPSLSVTLTEKVSVVASPLVLSSKRVAVAVDTAREAHDLSSPLAPLTVPPAVTLMPPMIRLASVSLPVVMLMLPIAVSLGSPLAPAAAASPEPSDSEPRAGSPASLTLWSPVIPTVGVEFRQQRDRHRRDRRVAVAVGDPVLEGDSAFFARARRVGEGAVVVVDDAAGAGERPRDQRDAGRQADAVGARDVVVDDVDRDRGIFSHCVPLSLCAVGTSSTIEITRLVVAVSPSLSVTLTLNVSLVAPAARWCCR